MKEIYPELLENNNNSFPAYYSRSSCGLSDSAVPDIKTSVLLDEALGDYPGTPEPKEIRKKINTTDPLIYMYTSGTTGLPKAVNISHLRLVYTNVVRPTYCS